MFKLKHLMHQRLWLVRLTSCRDGSFDQSYLIKYMIYPIVYMLFRFCVWLLLIKLCDQRRCRLCLVRVFCNWIQVQTMVLLYVKAMLLFWTLKFEPVRTCVCLSLSPEEKISLYKRTSCLIAKRVSIFFFVIWMFEIFLHSQNMKENAY